MKTFKVLAIVAAALGAFALNSCCQNCCTGVEPDQPLKPMPNFQPLVPSKK